MSLLDFARVQARLVAGAFKNARLGNRVDYRRVALNADVGHGVYVMPGTIMDAGCRVGSYTFIGYSCSVGRATIGRYTSIANYVSVGPGEHDAGGVATSSRFSKDVFGELTAKPVTVGNDVWIGVDAIIRRGVTVGDGAIVGANSFVSKDVPPFTVVAGSPARVIRPRFTPEQAAAIGASKWWELELDEARAAVERLERDLGLTRR